MTMTAAGADARSRPPSPSRSPCWSCSMISPGTTGTEEPPGITALSLRLRRAPRRHSASRSANGMPSGSSKLPGFSHVPRDRKDQRAAGVRRARGRRTTAGPLRRMVGTEAKLWVLLMVVGAPYTPNVGRERRLEARLAGLALERLEQRGLLAADVGAGADEGVQVEVDAASRGCSCRAGRPRRLRRAPPRSAAPARRGTRRGCSCKPTVAFMA